MRGFFARRRLRCYFGLAEAGRQPAWRKPGLGNHLRGPIYRVAALRPAPVVFRVRREMKRL